jgi:hypothetical protein
LILHKKICEHDQALIILMQIYIYIYQKIREKSKVEHNAINKEAEEVREETVPD